VAQCNYETYKKIIKTLLKQGAERDSINNKGDTPLSYLDEMRTSIAQVEIMPGEEDQYYKLNLFLSDKTK
jgi:hypothetical protein